MKNQPQLSPVFLIGAGRSGTKFLRDILGVSAEVSVIPYDVGYVWRYGNENISHDELTPDMLNDSIIRYIKNTLPKLTKNHPAKPNARVFIEKSVPNALRPAFVHSIYLEAKFIHLIRDGRSVTESALRSWQTPPERGYLIKKLRYFPWKNYPYALRYMSSRIKNKIIPNSKNIQTWGPRYKGIYHDLKTLPIEVVCAKQWKKCVENSILQLKGIKKENIIEVRYEDLMLNSDALDSICKFLDLKDTEIVIKNYENKVNRTHTKKWLTSLDQGQLDLINNEIEPLNRKIGYNTE